MIMPRRDWDKRARHTRFLRRINAGPELPVLGGASKRCWCGDTIGHEWYGKYAGLPHPPADEEEE